MTQCASGEAVSYFDPYDYERHLHFVARCAAVRGATVRLLGQTLDRRDLDCAEVGHVRTQRSTTGTGC